MEDNLASISIESNLDQVRIVGQRIKEICDTMEFTNVNSGEIELALVESVTNCIEHAYKFQTGNKIDVELIVRDKQLSLQIKDYGMPMTEQLSHVLNTSDESEIVMPDHMVESEQLPTSGWGVALVRTLCDSIMYEKECGCNKLSLTFDLVH